MRGDNEADLFARLAPVEAEVRKRLGNFVIAEDDQTLEGVVLADPAASAATRCATAEMFSGGHLAARMAPLLGAETRVPPRHRHARSGRARHQRRVDRGRRNRSAASCASESGASHALALLIELDEGADRPDFGGTICIGIADAKAAPFRVRRA